MTQKPPPKQFVKKRIEGTKFTLVISSAKGGVGKSTIWKKLAEKLSYNFVDIDRLIWN